ncbi:hypothetical protein BU25DRAFT_256988 [Macroventuria anomochaeta]|uniref:Uncharacterized protein n=1 Tax=Macroventuria anomochaeta TaxID=301207 RepID=A0ACB6S7W1_9PLEO|nr:uncharacterized protein BU25DRAFT_256988 [Macroventuria anomochaeta]KAF2630366.1 hypothetical protein BU25DRAFT_256988 [Macroventuria anomochaeta]
MDKALVNFLTVVQLVWWPLRKLTNAIRFIVSPVLHAVVFILSPIWIVGSFMLLPFIHLAKGLFHIITLPLQVKWLERIETLYIYLGTAGLIGCMTGAVLYFIFKFLSSSLSIDATSRVKPRKGRTTAEFRSARREKQDRILASMPPTQVVLDKASRRRRHGLLSQTIVEEEDSDF